MKWNDIKYFKLDHVGSKNGTQMNEPKKLHKQLKIFGKKRTARIARVGLISKYHEAWMFSFFFFYLLYIFLVFDISNLPHATEVSWFCSIMGKYYGRKHSPPLGGDKTSTILGKKLTTQQKMLSTELAFPWYVTKFFIMRHFGARELKFSSTMGKSVFLSCRYFDILRFWDLRTSTRKAFPPKYLPLPGTIWRNQVND